MTNILSSLTPGAQAHALLDAMEAVEAGNYTIFEMDYFGIRSKRFTGVVMHVNGLKFRQDYLAGEYESWTNEQKRDRHIDDIGDELLHMLYDVCKEHPDDGRKSIWLNVTPNSFCRLTDDGNFSEELAYLEETFGDRCVSRVRKVSALASLLTVEFQPSDAVLFKLTHVAV